MGFINKFYLEKIKYKKQKKFNKIKLKHFFC